MSENADPITLGELRAILDQIPRLFDRHTITLVVCDDAARGLDDKGGIRMKGIFDYVIKPRKRSDDITFYAGGEALVE